MVYLSYEDIRTHKISTYALLAGMVTAFISVIWGGGPSVGECLAGGALGVFFVIFGIVSREMGLGDGIVLLMLGLLAGIQGLISILFVALTVCAVTAAVLCILGKAGKRSRLPFVPFIFFGFLLYL